MTAADHAHRLAPHHPLGRGGPHAHHVVHHYGFFHHLLHPHLRRHIHLAALNVTVSEWQLVLWVGIVPLAWAVHRFLYVRLPASGPASAVMFGAAVALQVGAYVGFGLSRDGDLLFGLLWGSLVALALALALLPVLRENPWRGHAPAPPA